MPGRINLLNHKFGKLTVVESVASRYYSGAKKAYWKCLCECGKTKEISAQSLRHGTQSCGCLHIESAVRAGKSTYLGEGVAFRNTILTSYKAGAIKRNVSFDLTNDEFNKLIKRNCFYCGSDPKSTFKKHNREFKYNGIDRVDNATGYTTENSVPCCVTCNLAKRTSTMEDFLDMIKKIYERHVA